mmetsp:Transcript_21640/g.70059  ORF Transcript_21640/g.70059 Transcript_21640/m.70059 type:complete len:166 (-) Transcript_21640:898-1395(-)
MAKGSAVISKMRAGCQIAIDLPTSPRGRPTSALFPMKESMAGTTAKWGAVGMLYTVMTLALVEVRMQAKLDAFTSTFGTASGPGMVMLADIPTASTTQSGDGGGWGGGSPPLYGSYIPEAGAEEANIEMMLTPQNFGRQPEPTWLDTNVAALMVEEPLVEPMLVD